jgi:hypothetical protein
MQAGLHRGLRNAQGFADLGSAQTFEVAQHDYFAVERLEPSDGLVDWSLDVSDALRESSPRHVCRR